MTFKDFLEAIRSRSREEWLEFYREKWINARIWMQEHAERAALGAFVLGMLLVLAFRFVMTLTLLVLLAAVLVYFFADPEQDRPD